MRKPTLKRACAHVILSVYNEYAAAKFRKTDVYTILGTKTTKAVHKRMKESEGTKFKKQLHDSLATVY